LQRQQTPVYKVQAAQTYSVSEKSVAEDEDEDENQVDMVEAG
jgi:hypothetical protein